MRLALVQFNPTVGALDDNAARIAEFAARAATGGADLIVFPELALCGYPPRDLISQEGFVEANREAALRLAATLPATTVLGLPWRPDHDKINDPVAFDADELASNSLVVIRDGHIIARYDKRLLPTYDVFDERRYFLPGDRAVVFDCAGRRVGLSICEDLWRGADVRAGRHYRHRPDPVAELIDAGAEIVLNPTASPFVLGKDDRQRELLRMHVKHRGVCFASVNQVGANDDLIFDGYASVWAPTSSGPRLVFAGPGFEEAIVTADLPQRDADWDTLPEAHDPLADAPDEALLWAALVLGVRDYMSKSGFTRALIGLSGGIDSAITAAVAAAAVGPDNVLGATMPSRYSSTGSVDDSIDLAQRLGVQCIRVPIEAPHDVMEQTMRPVWSEIGADPTPDITDENIQSRLRGLILMAMSNKTGALLLTTGNKSELAVGYCTLYGDMNGGLAVLSDVLKTRVFALARWLNDHHHNAGFNAPPIPETTITKPPSAELRPDQKDEDSLPPYDTLDRIIHRYVEMNEDPRRIVKETGLDAELVARIVRLIDLNEYKRKQMPIGLKVSDIAFGRGRRRPIVQCFRRTLDA